MSGVWGWFGGGAKQKELPKNAIIKLREQLEMLQKREKHVETQIDQQDAIARKNVTSNKNLAKQALKRKKMHETNLNATSAQIATLEQQIHSIETANLNYETLKVMQQAGKAMKQIHGNMNPDEVDNIMEEIGHQQQLASEVNEAITRPMGEQVDEDDLLEELDRLEQDELDKKMLGVGAPPVLSPVGVEKQKAPAQSQEEDEEEELRKLQAEMAM